MTARFEKLRIRLVGIAILVLTSVAIALATAPQWVSDDSVLNWHGNFLRPPADWLSTHLIPDVDMPGDINSSEVTAAYALKQAERLRVKQRTQSNNEERKFWLRTAIAAMLSEPQTKWALTQLGTLRTQSADSAQNPDYRTAKALWELASLGGDPVAACFIAELYRLGLGVAPDAERAAVWIARAKIHSGCNLEREQKQVIK